MWVHMVPNSNLFHVMTNYKIILTIAAGAVTLLQSACKNPQQNATNSVKPVIVTDAVRYDSDDPAIWINKTDPSKSLIIATDKDADGALYVYDLEGKTVKEKVVSNLKRPNNVDVAYGLRLGGKAVDIAVTTERMTHKLRVFSLPDMKPIDQGGLDMFVGEILWGSPCTLLRKERSTLLLAEKMGQRMVIWDNIYWKIMVQVP